MGSVILSLCLGGGKLGAAYYEEDTEMIRILHDISEDHNDLRLVNSLVRQVAPTVVLASTRQDERLLIFLKESCVWDRARAESEAPQKYHARKESLMTEEEEEEPVDINEDEQEEVDAVARTALHLMPNSSFSYEDAKRRLAALLGDESKNDTENQLTVAYRLNLDCVSMIRSMGALLKYIDVLRIGVEFEDLSVKTPISGIRSFTLEEMVEMDECTYKALQIFHEDNHPSVFKAGKSGGSKEGLSLFGICNRCRSSPGKVELRRWFQRPIVNRDVLRKRQAAVSFFLQDCNLDLTGAIHSSLKYVKNLSGIFKRMKSSQASVGDWISLYRTCYYIVHIASLLKSREVRKELLDELMGAFGEEVALTVAILGELADFQEMPVEDRFVVKRGVDRELDAKKDALSKLPETMSIIAHQELNDTLGQWVSTCAVVYLPMVGYLITVPKKPEWNTMEDCDPIPGVEFIFMSNDKVHYKNARMLQLDAELGDVTFQIIDMETSMMLRLQKQILERSRALLHAVRAAALIDCLISLALTAREHDWRRPELVDDPIIDVARARHPLVELVTSPFIPNPIRSGGNDTKMKVLTGSNASGKSIYLKQVGIVVFLAHLGSFVPAERARIGPFDRIFSRMHTIDSVLDGLSTFAKDLLQVPLFSIFGLVKTIYKRDERSYE
uniref:Uncharacterized protein n=1 Tax=Plectus sambesii TaxID=2011161 RepID=A0A914XL75_9BILA